MEKLTYKQAYDKIIEAYFKDEIKPFNAEFCFCGTLAPNFKWFTEHEGIGYPYSQLEYGKMEAALFSVFPDVSYVETGYVRCLSKENATTSDDSWMNDHEQNFEEVLFNGLCAALEVLKEIHRSRGENVDEDLTPFTKRNLSTQLVNQ